MTAPEPTDERPERTNPTRPRQGRSDEPPTGRTRRSTPFRLVLVAGLIAAGLALSIGAHFVAAGAVSDSAGFQLALPQDTGNGTSSNGSDDGSANATGGSDDGSGNGTGGSDDGGTPVGSGPGNSSGPGNTSGGGSNGSGGSGGSNGTGAGPNGTAGASSPPPSAGSAGSGATPSLAGPIGIPFGAFLLVMAALGGVFVALDLRRRRRRRSGSAPTSGGEA